MAQDQPQPQGIWLAPALLQLERTPAEKMLLAYICQRAAATTGVCTDTNKELAEAVNLHQKTVSEIINRLSQDGLLLASTQKEPVNQRLLGPIQSLLTGYPVLTEGGYPSKPDSALLGYPSKAEGAPPKPEGGYPPKAEGYPETVDASARPVRHCPVTGVEITHQGQLYPRVTEATLKHLFKTDPAQFAAVLKRCGLEVLAGKPMGTQCGEVKMYVDRQARQYDATH